MRDEDKPFVCYNQGWSMKIVPRGAAGWRLFGLWMVSLGLLVGLFLAVLSIGLSPGGEIVAVVVFLAATLVWTVAMIRWMLARSEVIDVARLIELKRAQDRKRTSRS